ncbi:MAG TPA: DNA mismatch repair protein MutS, partial [Candidatus Eisenbacteria bacterium]|nr:DNA mismatch repair protein MutS [Candidatus Eisenbacteria bacterium]
MPPSAAPAASAPRLSPLMAQYRAVKEQHPDAFLFFRLGDFYEMFLDDAVRGAELLGLTLTSRNKQDPEPIPMCGVPWHQRDAYVARLLKLGHKVAICEQLGDPAAARGLVERAVTEVLTPGSVTTEALLESAATRWLAALWPEDERLGVCLADASTGELRLADWRWEDAPELLAREAVAEWLLPATADMSEDAAARLDLLLAGALGARSVAAPGSGTEAARAGGDAAWAASLGPARRAA